MTPIAGILRRKPPAPRRAGRVGSITSSIGHIERTPGPWEPPKNNSSPLCWCWVVGCRGDGGDRGSSGGGVRRAEAAPERAAAPTCAGCGGPGAGARRHPLGRQCDRGGGGHRVARRGGAGGG